jgi:hypothetical protein
MAAQRARADHGKGNDVIAFTTFQNVQARKAIALEAAEAEPEGDVNEALFCSSRGWVEQTQFLREEKL